MSTLPIKIPVYCSWNSATSLHHSPCQSRLLINHHIFPSEMKPIISFHTHSHHFSAHPVNILSYTPLFRAEVSLWRAPGGSIRVEAPPIWLSPTSASFAAHPSSATGTAQCSENCVFCHFSGGWLTWLNKSHLTVRRRSQWSVRAQATLIWLLAMLNLDFSAGRHEVL